MTLNTSISHTRMLALLACAVLCALLSGCHKQTVLAASATPPPPPLDYSQPKVMSTVPPATHITPDAELEQPPAPPEEEKPKPVNTPPRKPRVQTPAPTQPTQPTPTPPVSIGVFTSGSDVSPQFRADTGNRINTVRSRIDKMPAQQARDHHEQMERARNFLKQAQDAWNSGDVEGASTLATKASVLLNDIQR